MKYQEILEDMFAKLPMFSRIGAAAMKPDLKNTLTLCEELNHPEKGLRCIHIAGTNGKGSVSNMLASILQEAGYKTGLYTSPHLKDFRERIRINGEMIPEEKVIHYYQELIEKSDEIKASFFEMTVVMAFAYFRDQNVDIAIIETGLGGRLDSTNVLDSDLSIITNIGYDHQQFLGNTLTEIASEKAGIIKSEKPVIIGQYQKETAEVFIKKALELSSPIYFSSDSIYNIEIIDNQHFIINNNKVLCPLLANYQIENIQTVLTALEVYQSYYKDLKISEKHIFDGLENIQQNTGIQGRWQILQQNPKVIADVGHNIDGIKVILHQLSQEKFRHLRIVYGSVKDKDVNSILKLLPHHNTSYYLCEPPLPRKLPLSELYDFATNNNLPIAYKDKDPKSSYHKALEDAAEDDLILVLGSFFIVGEVI
ncbi:MAG TPA: folylpolyglutamate synthase/dihydrofolate synthase family protein [Chitinophagales bacterium]|nr:folylpolyglutamate synthase/dihydrofolate synthase family protein [Chitinophagales bacterium]